MTLLKAVNKLMIARGVSPVQTLQPGHPYSSAAVVLLEESRTEIQDRGWWFNRDYGVQLTRDSSDRVAIPNEVIRVDGPAKYSTLLDDTEKRVLYDNQDHTIIFTEDPDKVDLIRLRSWENLPATAAAYIVAIAKEEFIRPLESALRTRAAEKDIDRKLMQLMKAELDNLDVNTITGSPLLIKLKRRTKMRRIR